MGKFTDTQYKNNLDTLVNTVKSVLNNPYYLFTDQRGTKVDYYPINKEKSTLDEDSLLHNATLGMKSAFRYNVIRDFFLFGIERVNLNIDVGDLGTEADPIEGEAVVLPNTIEPCDGDLFTITYLKEKIIFRVNGVNVDTLDNGSNMYKINYKIFAVGEEEINKLNNQLVDEYEFIAKNVGTDFRPVIKSTKYKLIEALEDLLEDLSGYYKQMFFKDSVQTFVYKYNGRNFYDPYLIEFCIRNKIFAYGSDYTYVTHQVHLPTTFGLNYAKTLFYSIENRDPQNVSSRLFSGMTRIDDITSLFYYKGVDYYLVDYCQSNILPTSRVEIFDSELVDNIKSNTYFPNEDNRMIFNPLIAYFNKDDDYIEANLLESIRRYDIIDNRDCFYGLIFSMYVIQQFIENMLK